MLTPSLPRKPGRATPHRVRRGIVPTRRSAGFTLIEILIVVVILGVLAAIVIPQFADAGVTATQTSFAQNLRTMARQVELFAQETGNPLPDTTSGSWDAQLAGYISESDFEGGTLLGGVWDIENDQDYAAEGLFGGVGVDFQGDWPGDDYMQEVDAILDDGSLSTGGCRKIGADRYYYFLR